MAVCVCVCVLLPTRPCRVQSSPPCLLCSLVAELFIKDPTPIPSTHLPLSFSLPLYSSFTNIQIQGPCGGRRSRRQARRAQDISYTLTISLTATHF